MTVFQPTVESLLQHQVPEWFQDAKLGVLITWGLYSVPGWAPSSGDLDKIVADQGWEAYFLNNPYAEWYLHSMNMPGSPTQQFHAATYGQDFSYDDFVQMFQQAIGGWEPDEWSQLIQQVGIQYAVLVAKHCDSYLLWPSAVNHPIKGRYQSERDLVGAAAKSLRAHNIRFGIYYCSGMDWTFEDDFLVRDVGDILAKMPQSDAYVDYTRAHWLELIDRYQPSVMWGDIGYPTNHDPKELFAYYLNNVPDGVINDRFAKYIPGGPGIGDEGVIANPGGEFFDFRTPEYTRFDEIQKTKWESVRGLAHTFGFNRNESPQNYLSITELIQMFVDIVSKNGNLLLSLGPEADGTVPEYQRERFLALGKWLKINGDGIYATRPWVAAEGITDQGIELRFTQKDNTLYAFMMGTPARSAISLKGIGVESNTEVTLLGRGDKLEWRQIGNDLVVDLQHSLATEPVYTLAITPLPNYLSG